MKNKALLYLLLAGGVILLISAKKKPKGKVIVEPLEKITEDEFYNPASQKTLLQKAAPIAKKLVQKIKAKRQAKKQVGYFPETF